MPSKPTLRRQVRSSFVTTIATVASAALAAGCANEVTFVGQTGGAGGSSSSATGVVAVSGPGTTTGQVGCPSNAPTVGAPCAQSGQLCQYDDYNQCRRLSATCDGGAWSLKSTPIEVCNPPPPPPACPKSKPQHAAPCTSHWQGTYKCGPYANGACPSVYAVCDSKTWQWSVEQVSCNPPPPEYCYTLTTEAKCESQWCEWKVPGCGAPALPNAGCHPRQYSCETSPWLCQSGTKCQKAVTDPCWNKDCAQCAKTEALCLP
jgi:hypothetical protein